MQVLALWALEYVPAEHAVHVEAPATAAYAPAAQVAHTALAVVVQALLWDEPVPQVLQLANVDRPVAEA